MSFCLFSVFSLVCSFINNDWKLSTHRIAVKSFDKQASGENIAAAITDVLGNFKYQKVIGSTRDGASNVEKACKDLGHLS